MLSDSPPASPVRRARSFRRRECPADCATRSAEIPSPPASAADGTPRAFPRNIRATASPLSPLDREPIPSSPRPACALCRLSENRYGERLQYRRLSAAFQWAFQDRYSSFWVTPDVQCRVRPPRPPRFRFLREAFQI